MNRNRKYLHLTNLAEITIEQRKEAKGKRVVVTHPNIEINHQKGILGDWSGKKSQRYWVTLDKEYTTKTGKKSRFAAVSTGCIWFLDYCLQEAHNV